MAEHGIDDFLQAKRKAADRLGVNDVAVLPKNVEIEAALRAHQRLFGRDSHDHTLKEQRRIALETMRLLESFSPGWWARCSPARRPTTATSICICSPTAPNRWRSD